MLETKNKFNELHSGISHWKFQRISAMINIPLIIWFIISIISLICSFFFPFIFLPILVIFSSSLLILCAFGGLKTKSIKVMFYLTLIIPCQVFGYGLGFFWAFIKRFIFGHDAFTGFEKKYY